jgi:serine/threonine-protein kinase
MGQVYLARDTTELERLVALKVLPADVASDPERMRRFVQEAKTASSLNHPNIITIHEIGEVGDSRFIVTELVDGETLRQRLTLSKLMLREALDISIQIASALVAAHKAGVVHRDIKPENVMLRADGILKVLDFGLAKPKGKLTGQPADPDAPTRAIAYTAPGVVMGTATYMSPEQARGLSVDERTDIWSLGVMLYEMVTGRVPFSGETASDVIAHVLTKEPPSLAVTHQRAGERLDEIVAKALAKDREERYQHVQDLLIDLKRLRQRLDLDAELERGTAERGGAAGDAATGNNNEGMTDHVATGHSGNAVSARATSSADYIVENIGRHRRVAIVVSVLALAAVAATYFVYSRHSARSGETGVRSVAVLPFQNSGGDPETEYLSDGITESIIGSLSQLSQLKVMARSTVFRYKGKDVDPQQVGRELGVQAVLLGRLIQQGDNLTVRAEMVSVSDGSELWGHQYNRKLNDLFAVQEEIAREISEKLSLRLSGAERQQLAKRPTGNLKAFQYYMQGRTYTSRRTREDLLTAIRYCERAIEEDHDYALAYAGIADAYVALGVRGYVAPVEARRSAEDAARKSLTLDDNLAEAHAQVGYTDTAFAPYRLSLGDQEMRRAIELSPSLAVAHQYLALSLEKQGRLDEALAEVVKARELDPLSSIIARQEALPYYFKRDYLRAIQLLRQANELGPALNTTFEMGIYIQNRSFDEALSELEQARRERKDDPILIYGEGTVYAAQGKRAEALQAIKELEKMSGTNLDQAHWIAKIYATLNEKEMAFSWLERGLAAGAIGSFYKDDPLWDTIRGDARFPDLLRRMGIPT